MKVREKILVTRATLPPMEEYFNEISTLWDSHWITNMGEKHKQLQKELCKYMGVSGLELMVNGHMALELTLQAMDLKGEVITSPFTFASTTHAIVRNGLKPVFCDIRKDDYTIDADKIEALITDKTCAIVPVHVYGNICDVEKINEIACKHNLKVIYDAAHTFGEKYKGIGVGNFGDASCFSFHATKVFNTIEGGAVSFHDQEIGKKIYNLKNFGIQGPEQITAVGANAKMNEFQASMGLCNLRHIDENIEKRKNKVELYISLLSNIKGLVCWKKQKDTDSNYAYFPIIIEDEYGMSRNQLFEILESQGIGSRKYFYPITSSFECYNNEYVTESTPVALDISNRVITLPLYPELEDSMIEMICAIIQNRGC